MNSRRRSPLLPIAGIPPILDKKNNLPLGLNAVGGWWLILWNRDIRVIMFHCVPACGPALYGLHSGGIESPLSCRLLLIAASCWWALGLIFFLCQGLVVNAKQQTVIHDLKAFQNLQRNEVSFEMFSYNIIKMFQGNLNKMFLLQNLFFLLCLSIHNALPLFAIFLTRQSRCSVLTKALYISWSKVRPSGTSVRKSRSLNVGLDFSLSFLDACLLYVEPLRSNLRCMRTERGNILFITIIRMFLPPLWTQ